ncbi:FlxA-like family protein [Clostridium beijerinckii]|uniref:Chromosome segregation ATPase n=2 Tax=Clostridium beijerinckii TaxID=1520 RepID=A0AAX0B933_CLOBE|nr:FlxA-like family protein [Clostridium beijerinckii]NRT91925.1 chromosome segregation ATPase [Clostridium beijerinckii]NYC71451.1 chromosome segregation ATPase [Clostridium beijerinckii]OOM66155.1 hypothetical protein CLOBI_08670 [Clostridium beijerinckii]
MLRASSQNNLLSINNKYNHKLQDIQDKKGSKSNSNSSIKATLTNYDKAIQALEKQKQNISEQIKNIKGSKMDDKSKEMLTKDLEKKISDLDSQINKQKMEKITQKEEREKANEEKQKSEGIEKNSDGKEIYNEKFNTMLKAYSGVSQLKTMQTVKINLENELRTEDNLKRRDKISNKLKKLKEKMETKFNEISDTMKDISNKDKQVNKRKDTNKSISNEKEAVNHKEKNEEMQSSNDNGEDNYMDKSKTKVDEYV